MPATTLAINGVTYYDVTLTLFDTLADLRTVPLGDNSLWTKRGAVVVNGSASFDDGNLFFYSWIPTSVEADNAPSVIQPTAITGAGRWKLIAWNNGGQPVISWKTGVSNPNTSGVTADGVGQRYFQTGDDWPNGTWYWNGTEWI